MDQEDSQWHRNYIQLKQLERILQKTIQTVEKSSNETEVEWLQLVAISNKLKGDPPKQPDNVNLHPIKINDDDEAINATPLDIKPKISLDLEEEEEFDSD